MRVHRILIRCPETAKPVDTGLETTSPQDFDTGLLRGQVAACPHCGQLHRWQKADAYLQVDDNPTTGRLWRPNL